MKQVLTLLTGLFCSVTLHADCAGSGLWVFPGGSTIKQNTVFVLDGYANSQKIILELNKKHSIYLKSGNKKVKLLVTEICVGEFYLTQAILKPESELEPGLEYTMCIDDLPEYESLSKYNTVTYETTAAKYKVVAERDMERPELKEKPKELEKVLIQYGCGPEVSVVFSNKTKDDSEIIVKTTVKNLVTGKETSYYIQPQGDKIEVGHGMCSGAFAIEDGLEFEVEFSFMDASGNTTPWTGERVKFIPPTHQTR